METAELIKPGFSVADADQPVIQTVAEGLRISFRDWQERNIQALFMDAVSFRWDMIEWYPLIDGERYDSTHIILNSEWLQQHVKQRAIGDEKDYNHYRLNFNASGCLQVIARGIQVESLEATGDVENTPQ